MKKDEQKEKRRKILIAIIAAIFLISSIASVVLYRQDVTGTDSIPLNLSGKIYNFYRQQNYYTVKVGDQNIRFYSYPSDVKSITVDKNIIEKLKASPYITITFDPGEEDLTYYDFMRMELREAFYGKYFIEGITNTSTTYSFPIITCANATSSMPVILLSQSNTTRIFEENNCIYMESKSYGFIRLRDRIVYGLNGMLE